MVDGTDCWGQFGAVLSWEWDDPALAALHFVTVASYNLQHPAQFTGEALAGLRQAYRDHLDHGKPVGEIRTQASEGARGGRRVLRPPEERRPVLRQSAMTISDVYQGGQRDGAAARVKMWAAAIRREM